MEQRTCPVVIDGVPCTSGQRIIAGDLCHYHYRQRKAGRELTAFRKCRSPGAASERDGRGRKQCGRCAQWRNVREFRPAVSSQDGLQSWCSPCSSDYMIIARYGFDRSTVERMLVEQGGCAICRTEVPRAVGFRNGWHVDHDHKCCPGDRTCGKCIRAILCADCNKLIGMARDSAELLLQAATYLRDCEVKHG